MPDFPCLFLLRKILKTTESLYIETNKINKDMNKETVELVKKMIEDGNLSQEIAEKYCPELKESKDERIRKELIETIHLAYDCGCSLNREQRDKYLDWLEKQGEHKEVTYLTVIHIGKSYKCIAVPRYTSFQLGKIYKPEDVFVRDLMNLCAPCFEEIDEKENKVSEQKPAEWSIFDYRTWQYIVADVLTKKEGIGQYLDDGTCKNIAKYMQEEWSKKLSTEQKPTWCKEDEDNFKTIIGILNEGMNSCDKGTMTYDIYKKMRDWFKLLQPKWKPSEEQMRALDEAVHGKIPESNALWYLYNDLKKLTE